MTKLLVELYNEDGSIFNKDINNDKDVSEIKSVIFKEDFLKTVIAEIDIYGSNKSLDAKSLQVLIHAANQFYNVMEKEAVFKISNPSTFETKVILSEELKKYIFENEYDINDCNFLLARGGSEKNIKDTINKIENGSKNLLKSYSAELDKIEKELGTFNFDDASLNEFGNLSIQKERVLKEFNEIKSTCDDIKDISRILNNKTSPMSLKTYAMDKSDRLIEKLSLNSNSLEYSYNIVVFKDKHKELFDCVKKEFNKEYNQTVKAISKAKTKEDMEI